MNTYEAKNKTLYEVLIDEQPAIFKDLEFYKNNIPQQVENLDKFYDKLRLLIDDCESIPTKDKGRKHNEFYNIISDVLNETEQFHFVMGYKTGAKMIIELMNE